ncbi:hypothetical protein [Pseudoclavibacter sp. AY1H1]|uniref:hypothetical protein n=1 Tax=Pseudoclavibacter sp. AY1H1 TaxID=2080584 RepID=UPI000CE8E12B|nr:hypothetical protein [Pseudoclavibacter sp. AY1H1]PPF38555.1 hypothetical protein C5E05_06015 [Pseudoclavibacter sp. AY1H1]
MTTATPTTTAPIELPELVALRARTEPIVLGVHVDRRFEQLGLNAQARLQRGELRARSYDHELPAAEAQELAWLEAEILRRHVEDQREYLELYRLAAQDVFREHGITASIEALNISGLPGGAWQFENTLIRTLAEQAHERTRLPMTWEPADYSEGSPADTLALDGFDYLSRATRTLATSSGTPPLEAAPAATSATYAFELSEGELMQLAMLLGLVSTRERAIAADGDAIARRIEAAADSVLHAERAAHRFSRH